MSSAAASQTQTIDFDRKLQEIGVELPGAAAPAANYVKAVRVDNLLFLSGHAAVSGRSLATSTK